MTFSHPLARGAKVWTGSALDGSTQRLLVVVTTLELDRESKKFKQDKVERLSDAVSEWLNTNTREADAFLLMNRFKDW